VDYLVVVLIPIDMVEAFESSSVVGGKYQSESYMYTEIFRHIKYVWDLFIF
jgi:hypothetical protein